MCCLRRQIRRKNSRKKKEWRTFRLIMIDSCGMYLRLIRVSLLFSFEFFFHSAFHAWLELEFHMNHVRVKDANFVYIVYNWRDWLPACLPVGANPNIFHVHGGRQLNCLSWMVFSALGARNTNVTWHDWPFLQRANILTHFERPKMKRARTNYANEQTCSRTPSTKSN